MIYMDLIMESEDSTSNNGDVKGYKFSGGSNGNTMGKKKKIVAPVFGPWMGTAICNGAELFSAMDQQKMMFLWAIDCPWLSIQWLWGSDWEPGGTYVQHVPEETIPI